MKPFEEQGRLCKNEQVGPNLYIMEIEAALTAQSVAPGQFLHVRIPGMEAHILRRPFSVYAANPSEKSIEILYQVVGFGTDHMTRLQVGAMLDMIGPLGTGWSVPEGAKRVLLIAGGVGAAPLFMLAEQLTGAGVEVDVILGAQTKHALVCHDRYTDLLKNRVLQDSQIRCSTDDGSFGHAGFCTALVEDALSTNSYDYGAVCGPEPMMRIVSDLLIEAQIPCQISFEKRMACGIGACLSCVVETTEGRKRACVDGPVFDAEKVVFA